MKKTMRFLAGLTIALAIVGLLSGGVMASSMENATPTLDRGYSSNGANYNKGLPVPVATDRNGTSRIISAEEQARIDQLPKFHQQSNVDGGNVPTLDGSSVGGVNRVESIRTNNAVVATDMPNFKSGGGVVYGDPATGNDTKVIEINLIQTLDWTSVLIVTCFLLVIITLAGWIAIIIKRDKR